MSDEAVARESAHLNAERERERRFQAQYDLIQARHTIVALDAVCERYREALEEIALQVAYENLISGPGERPTGTAKRFEACARIRQIVAYAFTPVSQPEDAET